MLRKGSDFNKIWKDCPSKNPPFSIYIRLVNLILVKSLYTLQEKVVWWEMSHIRSKVKGMKIDAQFSYFLRGKLQVKKIQLKEHGHKHKASESAKNPFLYPNFKSKCFVTDLFLAL